MQFGVILPTFGSLARGTDVATAVAGVARAADRLGYDVVWAAEHVVFPSQVTSPYPYGDRLPFAVTDPVLDAVGTLAWLAGMTTHVRLGSAVLVLPYHQPVPLAKALATVDVLSGGRLVVGVASGWLREEFALLGVPFAERGARTDEWLAVLRALWTEERVTFAGRWIRLTEAAFFPKPVQRPHPPVWIGGGSPAALRRVGRFGDGWLAVPRPTLEALAADVAAIRRAAERAGRDPARIGVASSGAAPTLAALVDRLPDLARIGVTSVTVPVTGWARSAAHGLELMEEFAQRAGLGG